MLYEGNTVIREIISKNKTESGIDQIFVSFQGNFYN